MSVYEAARDRVAAFAAAYQHRSLNGEVIAEVREPESGVCHCGESTDHHSVGDGHSPVDTAGGVGELLLLGDLRLLAEPHPEPALRASLKELIGAPDVVAEVPAVGYTGEEEDELETEVVEAVTVDRLVELLDDPYPEQPYVDRRLERPTVPTSWPENRYPTTEEFHDWLLELPRHERLQVLGATLSYARESTSCFNENHRARLEMADRDNRHLLRRLEAMGDDTLKAPVAP